MFVESRGCQTVSILVLSVWNQSCLSLFVYILTSALTLTAAILTGIRDNMFRDLDNPAPSGPAGPRHHGAGAGGGD